VNIIIDLTISGLIALVPNVAYHPSELTAYLVNEMDHSQGLKIVGDASLQIGSDNGLDKICFRTEQGGIVTIRCDLGDKVTNISNMDISIARQAKRPVKSLSPTPQGPIPAFGSEAKSSLNWLVRLSNIERSTGRVRPWTDLKNGLVGARLTFGWETASVAEVDGEEGGKVAKIGFRDADANPISLFQAVAESIRFEVPLDPGPFVVTLFDRISKTSRSITGNCTKSTKTHCVSMELFNNYAGNEGCEDGDHFRHFYTLVRNPGQEMLPYSTEPRPCDKFLTERWKDNRFKVLDRLICPPVLLEP
jgi:hypothetical protein